MKYFLFFIFLLLQIFTPAQAVNCVTVVLNAPGCDLANFQCQEVTLPNENTFKVRVVTVQWTDDGMQRLRRPKNYKRQYYYVRITQFQDGSDRTIFFLATFSAMSFSVSDEGLIVTEMELTSPQANDNLFGFDGSQEFDVSLPNMANLAALSENRYFLFDGPNLINRIDAATGADGNSNGVDYGTC